MIGEETHSKERIKWSFFYSAQLWLHTATSSSLRYCLSLGGGGVKHKWKYKNIFATQKEAEIVWKNKNQTSGEAEMFQWH